MAYWAAARIGLNAGALPGNAAPVWPAAGLALAAVFLWGPGVAPGIVIGEYFSNRNGLPTFSVLCMCAGNTLEALVAAALLKRAKVTRGLGRPRDVGVLLLLAAGLATVISAVIGNTALAAGHVFPHAELWTHLKVWWAGDALGTLIVTPLVFSWTDPDAPPFNGNVWEMVGLVVAMGAASAFGLHGQNPSAFLLYPVVSWAALRFGGRGASVTTITVAGLAVYTTVHESGPFHTGHPIGDLFLLDAFIAVLAAKGMLLAAVVAERDRSQRELRMANAELEARVAERTDALRVDRARLEQAQRIAHIGSWQWDALADVMTTSDEFDRVFGIDPSLARGSIMRYVECIHPDDWEMARDRVLNARERGLQFDFELRVVHPGAHVRWLRMQGQSSMHNGVVSHMNGIAQDITEAKLAEDVIHANEIRTTRIVEASSEAFVSMDLHQRITDWNRQAELTFGWAREEVTGKRLPDIIIPEALRAAHDMGVSRFLATGQINVLNTRREVTARHRDGHEFPIELAIWATEGAHGETFFHAFMHDISQRLDDKAALAHALEEAREASRSKSAFLANMSHEIRTPMNGVLGMVGLLLDTPLDAQQLDYVQTMATSAEALLGIIDDILDVSKIEAGKLAIEHGDFNLRKLVQETITPFMPMVTDKGIELTAHVAADVPDAINGDRLRLRQVISNLLSNAVKFTHHGAVSLRITRQRDCLLFDVLDTGIGIPADAASYLFDPFVQADVSTTRRFGGTGLGLAICRQLVTLMHGEIGAEPRDGHGSRFWFTLPLIAATTVPKIPERRAAAPAVLGSGRGRVLVVEDNAVNRKVAVGMLEQLGYSVEVAVDGVQAVDMFRPGAFDVILMDCQMPRMDGYDATCAIRALEPSGHTPIVAMTASAMASDRDRCIAVGMDDYLSKPINRDLLAAVLRQRMEGNTMTMTSSTTSNTEEEPFDAETLEQLRSLDEDGSFIAELVNMFRDDIATHVAALHAAIAAHDETTIARTAHQAKGASANLGMRALAASLKTLELSAGAPDAELHQAMAIVEGRVAEALAYADSLVAA
ncbi:MAG TPA: MASE1 domain-containing protein [Acidimicrobiales bacterium]|nr:MASE1 domain-containing protein [Acidimicrobiales bacterium]